MAGIQAEEVKRELEAGTRLFVLDVRDPHELKEELGHITGATNIPVTKLAHRLAELEPYRDREIITVCKSGGRAPYRRTDTHASRLPQGTCDDGRDVGVEAGGVSDR